jgi:DNA-binding transcriptional ArsR family regulator
MSSAAEPDIAAVAAAIGDPSRTRVLCALGDGRALPASALAAEAGVTNSTISGHLARLLDAKLLTVEHDGRQRHYRLASTDVARALEELARIAQPLPPKSLRGHARAQALLRARLCYDHLAGRLGVALMTGLVQRGVLAEHGNEYQITTSGQRVLDDFGVDPEAFSPRRPPIRYCVDWGEQRHHLAGALGGALADRMFALGWIRRGNARRVIRVTDAGVAGLTETFGVAASWADDPTPT